MLELCKEVLYEDTQTKTLGNTFDLPKTMVSLYMSICGHTSEFFFYLSDIDTSCDASWQLMSRPALNNTKSASFGVIISEHDCRTTLGKCYGGVF